MVGYLGRSRPL